VQFYINLQYQQLNKLDSCFITFPLITRQNGVSKNPDLLTLAHVVNEAIKPTFCPSGVSIGQIRP
jgi:hypothetical protein